MTTETLYLMGCSARPVEHVLVEATGVALCGSQMAMPFVWARPIGLSLAVTELLDAENRDHMPCASCVKVGTAAKADAVSRYEVDCQDCGQVHAAEPSHVSPHSGRQVFAVVCGEYVEHYTDEVVREVVEAPVVEAPAVEVAVCDWFALCENDAVGTTPHPILGDVLVCARCAERFELVVEPLVAEPAPEVWRTAHEAADGAMHGGEYLACEQCNRASAEALALATGSTRVRATTVADDGTSFTWCTTCGATCYCYPREGLTGDDDREHSQERQADHAARDHLHPRQSRHERRRSVAAGAGARGARRG
jgi:hypothetical protein